MDKPHFLLLFTIISCGFCLASALRHVNINPSGPVTRDVGENVTFTCTILSTSYSTMPYQLQWDLDRKDSRFKQEWAHSGYSLQLSISNIQEDDAGSYTCSSLEPIQPASVMLFLGINKQDVGSSCGSTFFTCFSSGNCIFQRFRCDGVKDCKDGSDELLCPDHCLVDEFRCGTGQCISRELVCDSMKSHDCRDGTDECNCPGRFGNPEACEPTTTTDSITKVHHHHGFHFNAFYQFMAVLCALILVFSVLICTVKRMQKRAAAASHTRSIAVMSQDGAQFYFYGVLNRLNGDAQQQDGVRSTHHQHPPGRIPWRRRPGHNPTVTSVIHQPGHDMGAHQMPLLPRYSTQHITGQILLNLSHRGVPEFPAPPPHTSDAPPSYDQITSGSTTGNGRNDPERAETPPPPYCTLDSRGGNDTVDKNQNSNSCERNVENV